MANADSNTIACPEIGPTLSTLLKNPLGASHDLFQVLEGCQGYVDELIDNNNLIERMALCGRLLAGLEGLKSLMLLPLPEHLIERLTLDNCAITDYGNPLATDSETLRSYCFALTMVLLNQQESPQQEERITEMLFDMVHLLAEDLKAPRFVQTGAGLKMLDGEAVSLLH